MGQWLHFEGRGKGCLRPWGSCRAGEDDQESPFPFSVWDGEMNVSPLPAVTNMEG